jgi:hypothetical protein
MGRKRVISSSSDGSDSEQEDKFIEKVSLPKDGMNELRPFFERYNCSSKSVLTNFKKLNTVFGKKGRVYKSEVINANNATEKVKLGDVISKYSSYFEKRTFQGLFTEEVEESTISNIIILNSNVYMSHFLK